MIRNHHNATSFYYTVELLRPVHMPEDYRARLAAKAIADAALRRERRNEKRKANWTGRVRTATP